LDETSTELELSRGSTSRLFFLDNLRIALVALVVLHHVAMMYGAAGLFYYVEFHPDGFSRGLLVFVLTNQAWFMGLLFLIAGYFTPGSFDRKGASRFLRDRSRRLGIPAILYALLLNPLAWVGALFLPDYLNPLTWETYEYWDYVRMGPVWFLVMLLVFSLLYAFWRGLRGTPAADSESRSATPGYISIGLFTLALAGASYWMRTRIPIGEEVAGFPSLAYLPQYLSFFAVGGIAFRRNWLRSIPWTKGLAGGVVAILATIFLFPLAFSGEMLSMDLSAKLSEAMGEGHWRSAVYALWESTFAVGVGLALIVVFRTFLNRQGKFGAYLSRHSYTVYIIHIPVVVFIGVALSDFEIEHLLKVSVAGLIALIVCWALAYPIRKIPGASKIL
jgi:glucan biosynthesis protein C